ncbi:hypothetical protein [Marilutibacter alkalisoli]|uniref:Uncharacterized protein n=1 Tax=Marilutibacter alkalisoli TaxID=2591633 RepID=A0A514BU32_9GAMM|nr:hypothetical protein [Lysobacter alkalisoli]QDH70890.1 hypothetical protein FKV23_12935 [Lysobacter alkalisoli]
MSQWGEARTIDGITMVPRIRTDTWEPASPAHVIESIHLVDRDPLECSLHIQAILVDVERRYVDRMYIEWLNIPLQLEPAR